MSEPNDPDYYTEARKVAYTFIEENIVNFKPRFEQAANYKSHLDLAVQSRLRHGVAPEEAFEMHITGYAEQMVGGIIDALESTNPRTNARAPARIAALESDGSSKENTVNEIAAELAKAAWDLAKEYLKSKKIPLPPIGSGIQL